MKLFRLLVQHLNDVIHFSLLPQLLETLVNIPLDLHHGRNEILILQLKRHQALLHIFYMVLTSSLLLDVPQVPGHLHKIDILLFGAQQPQLLLLLLPYQLWMTQIFRVASLLPALTLALCPWPPAPVIESVLHFSGVPHPL